MALQAWVRGWLARRAYGRVRRAVVLAQCCVRRRAARRQLLGLKAEARSVEKIRQLNKGMEVKLMQLQLRADHEVRGEGEEGGEGQASLWPREEDDDDILCCI